MTDDELFKEFGFRSAVRKPRAAPKAPRASKTPKGIDPTVRNFIHVLKSKWTQWDMKESLRAARRGQRGNIYALGLLLGAAQKVEDEVSPLLDNSDAVSLNKLKSAIEDNFTVTRTRDAVLKQIDQYLLYGTRPSLVRK